MLNDFAALNGGFRFTPQLKQLFKKKLGIVLKSLQSWRGVRNYPFLRYFMWVWFGREMSLLEEEARRKGLNVRIRNAEPYREFQNNEDNDRSGGSLSVSRGRLIFFISLCPSGSEMSPALLRIRFRYDLT